MRIFQLFVLLSIVTAQLFSAPLDEKRIVVSKIDRDVYRMRVYFNYENPYSTQATLRGKTGKYFITLPIPKRFNVQKLRTEVKYTPSLVLNQSRSIISIVANQNIIRQFRLNEQQHKDSGKISITSEIPINFLDDYNKIGVQLIQHYASGSAEDAGAPELWSQIDLQNSFVEVDFKLKDFEEKISSIENFLFDPKNIIKDSVNFVFPKIPSDVDFFNYGFMANQIGDMLKFRDIDFSISTKIMKNRNNVIILPRKDLDALFKDCSSKIKNFKEKIAGNINLIQNPKRTDKGILVITGDSQEEIKRSLFRLANRDIFILEEQNIKVFNTEIPTASKPFTTPNFVKTGKKILFSELGYKTKTFFGEFSEPLFLNFKIYPTIKFNDANSITTNLNMIQGGIMRNDSVTNIFLNNVLASQVRVNGNQNSGKSSTSQRFELAKKNLMSAQLLSKGSNSMKIDFAMIPEKSGQGNYNNKILKLTLRDDSSMFIPQGKTEIELPSLKYIQDLAFPYSIYPDLRKTGILITDFDSRTISSAMYVSFFLGKMIDYPSYRLTITPDINKVLDKDIITIGNQIERYSMLYKNAPIRFTKDGVIKETALSSKFTTDDSNRRVKKQTATTKVIESINFNDYLIAQTYQSPFNKKRVVLEITAHNPKTLINGIRKGFVPLHLSKFNGDTWLYNLKTDKSFSFRLKDSYILNEILDDEDIADLNTFSIEGIK